MTRERFCRDCGEIFDAVDDDDLLCKPCLLKEYRALIAKLQDRKGIIEHEIRELNRG